MKNLIDELNESFEYYEVAHGRAGLKTVVESLFLPYEQNSAEKQPSSFAFVCLKCGSRDITVHEGYYWVILECETCHHDEEIYAK